MIEKIEDLGLQDLMKEYGQLSNEEFAQKKEEVNQRLDAVFVEKLGVGITALKEVVSKTLVEKASQIVQEMARLVPFDDYDRMIEDRDQMVDFLRTEAFKMEHWHFHSINEDRKNKNLLQFVFENAAVDDGRVLQGIIFTNKSGVIRHSFVQVDL